MLLDAVAQANYPTAHLPRHVTTMMLCTYARNQLGAWRIRTSANGTTTLDSLRCPLLTHKSTDTNYPWCLAKIWNYATPATEWDCATVNELITLEPNYNLIATTSAEATTSTIVSITNLPQTTTITTSQPPPSSPAAAAPSSAASSAPSGNGDGDSNNGNGNSQNDGNTYQGPVTINNGKSAAGPSTFGTLVQAIQLMLGLGFPVLLLLT